MIDKGIYDKEFIWNPSNCECECDKSFDIEQCLDYKNCKCRNRFVDKLVKECSGNIDANEMIYNDYINAWNSCTMYIALFIIAFLIIIGISSAFIYFHWCMLILITKNNKRNRKKDDDNAATSSNFDDIVIFPIHGQFGAIRNPDSRCIALQNLHFH